MPPAPLPPEVVELVQRPNPAVIASLRPDGSPHTVANWYDWDDGYVLVNMADDRLRLRFLRADPRVSLTVLDADSWYRQVSLFGRVARIDEDVDLKDADRLAQRYMGSAYPDREGKRYSARIRVDAWHGWSGSDPWPSR
jgi:PPOX class probable F420-dependent enzyme